MNAECHNLTAARPHEACANPAPRTGCEGIRPTFPTAGRKPIPLKNEGQNRHPNRQNASGRESFCVSLGHGPADEAGKTLVRAGGFLDNGVSSLSSLVWTACPANSFRAVPTGIRANRQNLPLNAASKGMTAPKASNGRCNARARQESATVRGARPAKAIHFPKSPQKRPVGRGPIVAGIHLQSPRRSPAGFAPRPAKDGRWGAASISRRR